MRSPLVVFACGILFIFAADVSADRELQKGKSEDQKISLVQIGTRTDGDNREIAKLLAVMIGDTSRAETEAVKLFEIGLGPNSIDGTIWVRRDESRSDSWRAVTYSAPRTLDELELFKQHPELFTSTKEGGTEILPHPFKKLNDANLAQIEFIVSYKAGGMKAYIFPEADAEAEALFTTIRDLLNVEE